MVDVHDAVTRSRNMAAIRSRHSKPELLVRKALHAAGLRFRLHVSGMRGTPDLVLPRWKAVVFVHGCYWHNHDCHLFKWPTTRTEFWREKICRNVANDVCSNEALRQAGWRVAVVWECALKGRTRLDFDQAMQALAIWIKSEEPSLTIRGA